MSFDYISQLPEYSMHQEEKRAFLLPELNELTRRHTAGCPEYRRLLNILYPCERPEAAFLEQVPYLPVSLFKQFDLLSIRRDELFKTLVSSGTTTGTVSRIYLDSETAARQTRALVHIMSFILGSRRLPMILIDTADTIKDRDRFSARGAGLLGMATFGRDHFYALDGNMNLDIDGLRAFLRRHSDSPVLLFGFTFMVWQYFHRQLELHDFDLSRGILIHSGGWKKLQEEAVGNAEFKEALERSSGLKRIYNFYGMVEQVGSVFVECEAGYLHTPNFAEVVVRDPLTWQEAALGAPGVIQVMSILPLSYPGHSLLTEDLGVVHGVDDCRCGRLGKYFSVLGRVANTELRGCSDTHAYNLGVAA